MRWIDAALVVLVGVGVIAVGSMIAAGPEPRWRWGYVAATVTFILSAAQMAPLLALSSRIGRGFWGARLRRAADLLGVAGLVSAPVMIVLLLQLPDWHGRASLWFDWPGAPGVWDALAVLTLAAAGAGLAWVVTWPERGGWGWAGTPTQWRVLTRGVIALGGLYALLLVFVHLLVVSDFALSLVPGWHSAVIAPYHVESGFEAAIGMVVLLLAATRELDARVSRSCAKLLLSLSLLWFYFVWCELLTNWYGRTPDEQSFLMLFMFGPTSGLFAVATACELLVPLLLLVWSAARSSPRVVTFVAGMVVLGNYVDRLRLYVPAWTVATPTPTEHLPESLPAMPLPDLVIICACAGVLALAALLVVLALRSVSTVSDWEVKAVERLTPERRVLRTRTIIVARPS
jgi:Ni/Fe-hydrogenase subunit HybB-like protein